MELSKYHLIGREDIIRTLGASFSLPLLVCKCAWEVQAKFDFSLGSAVEPASREVAPVGPAFQSLRCFEFCLAPSFGVRAFEARFASHKAADRRDYGWPDFAFASRLGVPFASVSDRLASQRGVPAVHGAGSAARQTAPGTAGRLVGEAGRGNSLLETPCLCASRNPVKWEGGRRVINVSRAFPSKQRQRQHWLTISS